MTDNRSHACKALTRRIEIPTIFVEYFPPSFAAVAPVLSSNSTSHRAYVSTETRRSGQRLLEQIGVVVYDEAEGRQNQGQHSSVEKDREWTPNGQALRGWTEGRKVDERNS